MPDAPASAAERLERLPLSPYHRLVFVIKIGRAHV